MTRLMLLPVIASLTLAACATPDPAVMAVLDAHDADTQLPLSSLTIDGWTVMESCRPHLCHLHKRVVIVSPGGESMVVVIAPAVNHGKPAAVEMHSRGWDAAGMPPEVRKALQAALP